MTYFYIRQTAKPTNYLHVEIDPGGMSVCWMEPKHATKFDSKASAESMVARLVERYPADKVYISEE